MQVWKMREATTYINKAVRKVMYRRSGSLPLCVHWLVAESVSRIVTLQLEHVWQTEEFRIIRFLFRRAFCVSVPTESFSQRFHYEKN